MEVSAEAKRIMVVALGKLYSSRTQRGGLRLHRSLLLSLVMKSARDIYHEAQAAAEPGASDWEQGHHAHEKPTERAAAAQEPRGHGALTPQQPQPAHEEVAGAPTEPPRDARAHAGAENKENVRPASPERSRKRRSKAAAEPDFLPCKKAKLEQGIPAQHHVIAGAVLMDYVSCGGDAGASAAPVPLHRAVAVC
ncbi:immediate early response gene 2 protein [Betta splendens]|uniref:Immediate early response gene 2 protein n=1 Tax=Betta splendens TaxID=158456 RepID=A0A6P7NBW0_BETSP|nr:immediate early response gene 2 protein [Betta splendens]